MPKGVVLRDGELSDVGAAVVDLTSPMWTSGQSLFETLLVWPTSPHSLYLEVRHARRMIAAARRLGWPGVPEEPLILRWMRRGARLFRERFSGYGRMRVTVAWVESTSNPQTFLTVLPYARPSTPLRTVKTDVHVPALEGTEVPKSGNRLVYGTAEKRAGRAADEAILVDDSGQPVEGAKSNLFGVRGRVIRTPSIRQGVLAGIARGRTLELARHMGLQVEEAPFDQSFVTTTESLFMTNALWGVRPVASFDGRAFRVDAPAIVALQSAYAADVRTYLRTGTGIGKLL